MADLTSKVTQEFDAATSITLRNLADGAETGVDTDAETPILLNTLKNAYWDNSEVPNDLMKCNVLVTAATFSGTNAYTLHVEVDDNAGFGSAKEVHRVVVERLGFFLLHFSSSLVQMVKPGATHLRITAEKVGDSVPSITYGAWLTYVADAA